MVENTVSTDVFGGKPGGYEDGAGSAQRGVSTERDAGPSKPRKIL